MPPPIDHFFLSSLYDTGMKQGPPQRQIPILTAEATASIMICIGLVETPVIVLHLSVGSPMRCLRASRCIPILGASLHEGLEGRVLRIPSQSFLGPPVVNPFSLACTLLPCHRTKTHMLTSPSSFAMLCLHASLLVQPWVFCYSTTCTEMHYLHMLVNAELPTHLQNGSTSTVQFSVALCCPPIPPTKNYCSTALWGALVGQCTGAR